MKNNGSSGLGLGGVLTVVFVVLKLVGTIDWSWWWVLSPIWIGIGLNIVIALIEAAVAVRLEMKKQNRRK